MPIEQTVSGDCSESHVNKVGDAGDTADYPRSRHLPAPATLARQRVVRSLWQFTIKWASTECTRDMALAQHERTWENPWVERRRREYRSGN